MLRTLSGEVNLNIHIRKCPDHAETNRNTIDALVNGSGFDPRVTIAVGLLRWIMDYQMMCSLYYLDTYKREYIEIRRYKGESRGGFLKLLHTPGHMVI